MDTQALLEQARKLGEALASHARVKAYMEARQAASQDSAAQQLLKDYQQAAKRIQQLQMQNKPIEVADKHKLGDLEAKMAGNSALKALMRAQADYLELMNQIDRATDEGLAGSQPTSAAP